MNNKSLEPPKATIGDVLHTGASTVAGLASLVGLVGAGKLFKFIVASPLEKRTQEWMQNVAEAVDKLQTLGSIDVQSIQSNAEFVTFLTRTTLVAIQTHQAEKRDLLKQCLMNCVLSDIDFDIKQLYISLVDRLTITQVVILKVVAEYGDVTKNIAASEEFYDKLIQNASFQYKEHLDKVNASQFTYLIKTLQDESLVDSKDGFLTVSHGLIGQGRSFTLRKGEKAEDFPNITVTDFGREFLRFITTQDS
jgi:hypothetical protein